MLRYSNVLLINARGEALILRRSGTHPHFPFEADLPGGTLAQHESHEDGLIREVEEETGIKLSRYDLIEVYREIRALGTKEQTLFISHLVEEQPDIVISWEHDQFDWIPLRQLENIADTIDRKITKILESKEFSALLQ